jgi:hypothetical protein
VAYRQPEIEFYNGGDAKHEMFSFDQPATDTPHAISYWPMQAPKEGYFKVPREMPTPFGGAVLVEFATSILERFGDRGFVAIDATGEFTDEQPWANTREEAKKKGDKFWRAYCRAKIEDWSHECNQRKSRNLPSAPASGFIKHAHRVLGLSVPEDEIFAKAANSQSDVDALREQVAALTKLVKGQQSQGASK